MLDQQGDILPALSQRRQVERNDFQSIKEILAERAFFHHLFELSVRRCDDAHIGIKRLFTADPIVLLLLQDPQ